MSLFSILVFLFLMCLALHCLLEVPCLELPGAQCLELTSQHPFDVTQSDLTSFTACTWQLHTRPCCFLTIHSIAFVWAFIFTLPQINKSSTNGADKCPQGSQWLLITLSSFLATLILQNYAMKKIRCIQLESHWMRAWIFKWRWTIQQWKEMRSRSASPSTVTLYDYIISLAPLCIRCCVCYMGGRHTGKVMAVTERKRYNKIFLGY